LWANNLLLVAGFVVGGSGSSYGIGPWKRLRLAYAIRRVRWRLECMSSWRQHLLLARAILNVPKDLEGDVVECGCYNGGSTASLSLACAATGRRLFVCDSFVGLSEPRDDERDELPSGTAWYTTYEEGDLASQGGVEGVRANVERLGDVSCCTFVQGFFEDTLDDLDTDSIVLVFEDVDLRSSTEDCVRALWPKLREGCKFFCHEPNSPRVVSLFYDDDWWRENLDAPAPGFVGSGVGIREVLLSSRLGFAAKQDPERVKLERTRLDLRPTRADARQATAADVTDEKPVGRPT
jgi:hypothetical protein